MEYVFVRGINCEVSMPTGSLCAERNCISQALSRDLSLRRTDLAAIAILSLKGYLRLPGASHYDQFIKLRREADRKAARAAAEESKRRKEEHHEALKEQPLVGRRRKPVQVRVHSNASVSSDVPSPSARVRSPRLRGTGLSEGYGSLTFSRNASSPLAKRRRVEGNSLSDEGSRDKCPAEAESVSSYISASSASSASSSSVGSGSGAKVVGEDGRGGGESMAPLRLPANNNPIDPCGVCNEWLRKISEVNPAFKVLNFADVDCEQVFVRSVR